jgi:hypothetical protein
MTSQNPTKNDPKSATTPPADAAPKPEEPHKPSEIKRDLTEEEIAAIAAGGGVGRQGPLI